jgi:hypothetical protein
MHACDAFQTRRGVLECYSGRLTTSGLTTLTWRLLWGCGRAVDGEKRLEPVQAMKLAE